MATVERGELQVIVPVGFLLAEAREVTVSVDRPGFDPLPVRLRLIPARTVEVVGVATLAEVRDEPSPTPRRVRTKPSDDIYGEPEYGGGD